MNPTVLEQPHPLRIWEHHPVAMGEVLKAVRNTQESHWGENPTALLRRVETLEHTYGFSAATGLTVGVPNPRPVNEPPQYLLRVDDRGMLCVLPMGEDGLPERDYTLVSQPRSQGYRLMREQQGFLLNVAYMPEKHIVRVDVIIDRNTKIETDLLAVMTLNDAYNSAKDIAATVENMRVGRY